MPILFSLFINDLDTGTECASASSQMIQNWEKCLIHQSATIQSDVDRLENWAERNFVKFHKGKCQVLRLGRNNPRHQHVLRSNQQESSSAEKDLGVLVDNKLTMSHQCSKKSQQYPGLH